MDTNTIILGDCIEVMKTLPDNSVDSCVTDPPYGLVSIQKRFGKENSAPAQQGKDGSFARLSGGFMGKKWDGTGIENNVEMWSECLRVLKPGGHLLAFSGTRTYHRMACAIEDAGFEVRDMIEWVYGSGFPKSHNIGLRLDQKLGLQGFRGKETSFASKVVQKGYGDKVLENGKEIEKYEGKSDIAKQYQGWGTALKPAHEPICMARKPLAEKTVAENVLKYGTGGINIDESRVEGTKEDNDAILKKHDSFSNTMSGNIGVRKLGDNEIIDAKNKQNETIKRTIELGRFPANLILTWKENEYIIKEDITNEQKEKVCTWLQKNL